MAIRMGDRIARLFRDLSLTRNDSVHAACLWQSFFVDEKAGPKDDRRMIRGSEATGNGEVDEIAVIISSEDVNSIVILRDDLRQQLDTQGRS